MNSSSSSAAGAETSVIDWATYGLPECVSMGGGGGGGVGLCSVPSPRGSSSSAWNALHGLGDFYVATAADNNDIHYELSPSSPAARYSNGGDSGGAGVHCCPDCGESFVTKKELSLHKKTHAMDRKFQCLWCPANFRTLSHLKTHVSRKHLEIDPSSLTAQIVKAAAQKTTVAGQANSQSMQENYSPPLVSSTGSHAGNHFALHSVKVAGFKREREYAEDEEEEPDEFTMNSPIIELQHRVSSQRHGSISSVCSEEQKNMASAIAAEHIEFIVPEVTETTATPRNSDEFNGIDTRMLLLFQGSGSDRRTYRCPICLYCFKQPKGVDDHLPSHESGSKHECYFCMRGFDNTEELIKHTSIHLGDTQFQCSICSKTFRKKSGLKTHLVKNHGKRMRTNSPSPSETALPQLQPAPQNSMSSIFVSSEMMSDQQIPSCSSSTATTPANLAAAAASASRKLSLSSSVMVLPAGSQPEIEFHDEFATL